MLPEVGQVSDFEHLSPLVRPAAKQAAVA